MVFGYGTIFGTVMIFGIGTCFGIWTTLWITLTIGGSHPQSFPKEPLIERVPKMSTRAENCIIPLNGEPIREREREEKQSKITE